MRHFQIHIAIFIIIWNVAAVLLIFFNMSCTYVNIVSVVVYLLWMKSKCLISLALSHNSQL